MKKIDINLFVKLSVIIAILLTASSFFYHYVIFIPNKEIQKQRSESTQKFKNEGNLFMCTSGAYDNYRKRWIEQCRKQGMGKNCELDIAIADRLNRDWKDEKADCYRSYGY